MKLGVKIMVEKIVKLLDRFNIDGEFEGYEVFNSGHINTTCLVKMKDNNEIKKYVLQKINDYVFKKPAEVMDNIVNVTDFVREKIESNGQSAERKVLKFLPAQDDKYYVVDNGEYWRMYEFVDKSVTFDSSDDLKVMEETGKAFGEFQNMLADFPSNELNHIIPHFHNTPNRYKIFEETLDRDPVGRVEKVGDEIVDYMELKDLASTMYNMQKAGELKLRVTHNDTKCNNVLFDEDTKEHLCVIDLDTVMPGLVGFDFGDAIRFGANTSAEDETDLDKVSIDLEKFDAFARGFLDKVAGSLSAKEIDTLALGAITMTIECGLRFLTDYIDGDKYFGIKYPEHNLDRARCQLALAQDMIRNYEKMQYSVYSNVSTKEM